MSSPAPVHEDRQLCSSCWAALSAPRELLPPCCPYPCTTVCGTAAHPYRGGWDMAGEIRSCATALGCYVLALNIEVSEELQSRSIGWGLCGGPATMPELGMPA